jgi:nucleotide-binding universal stress UspA family protein
VGHSCDSVGDDSSWPQAAKVEDSMIDEKDRYRPRGIEDRAIAHATDFSEASSEAFAHALALALAYKHHLYLLHVKDPADEASWSSFPHVREVLARWGMMAPEVAPSEIETKLGIRVAKVEIDSKDAVGGIFHFILSHRPDVLVLATHGREGFERLLYGSKAEEIARHTHVPTLFIGPEAHGFVDKSTGEIRLERILIPVAHSPSPTHSLHFLMDLLAPIGVSSAAFQFVHVGETAPQIFVASDQMETKIEVIQGPIVETLLRIAQEHHADMIAMPTAGHHGFLDALRGSTTERVLRRAPCPVLAIPAPA